MTIPTQQKQPSVFGGVRAPKETWLSKALPESVIEPDLPIIDPHVHFWILPNGYKYFLEEFAVDVAAGGHNIGATVFVECNAMFTRVLDFNRKARRWARAHGKPMVGNGDVHRLRQLGSTYSVVDARPEAGAICEAIRNGRVEVHAEPLSIASAATFVWQLMARDLVKGLLRPAPAGHL